MSRSMSARAVTPRFAETAAISRSSPHSSSAAFIASLMPSV
jgi:hypothetical protein